MCDLDRCSHRIEAAVALAGCILVVADNKPLKFLGGCSTRGLILTPASGSSEIVAPLLPRGASCGFFDFHSAAIPEKASSAEWGVTTVPEEALRAVGVDGHDGVRVGEMYFVTADWYSDHVSADGLLSAVYELRGVRSLSSSDEDASTRETGPLVERLRAQHADLAIAGRWMRLQP
jgi:hypothetical protein